MQTKPETVTDDQILILRDVASGAGDLEQVAICDLSLDNDPDARATCADVITNCEAQF